MASCPPTLAGVAPRSGRLDVRAFDVIQVGTLDAHQLGQAIPFWRVYHTDIVEVRASRLPDVAPFWRDQRRVRAVARLDDTPVSHFVIPDRESVDRPA